MIFEVDVYIEAPVESEEAPNPYPQVQELLRKLEEKIQLPPSVGRGETGAFEVPCRRWCFSAALPRKQFDQVAKLLDLSLQNEETVAIGPPGPPTPLMVFAGDCLFTEKHELDDMRIVDVYATPYPSFEPKNRVQHMETTPDLLGAGDWMDRGWRRIRAALKKAYP